jgi:hypothetical protein
LNDQKTWFTLIKNEFSTLGNIFPYRAQMLFLEIVKDMPEYGSTMFIVKVSHLSFYHHTESTGNPQNSDTVRLSIGSTRIDMFEAATKKRILKIEHNMLINYYAKNETFSLTYDVMEKNGNRETKSHSFYSIHVQSF